MTYALLGQNLWDIADRAKAYFAAQHGARNFKSERPLEGDLPLKPTWQATVDPGYLLCIDVRESPFSSTLYEFVNKCASLGLPIRLWVAVPKDSSGTNFAAELRQAREAGVGVIQFSDDGAEHVFHRPIAPSLFGLKKTDLATVPKRRRDSVKTAESTFLDGSPAQGCQEICQELEQLTREFAEYTHSQGWWKQPAKPRPWNSTFFRTKPWANVLEDMEHHLEIGKVRHKSPGMTKQSIVRARGHTDWRNEVSHRPKTFRETKDRDARLRTMFESTRDILVEWYGIAKPFKLVK
jgi:hypothetical protein